MIMPDVDTTRKNVRLPSASRQSRWLVDDKRDVQTLYSEKFIEFIMHRCSILWSASELCCASQFGVAQSTPIQAVPSYARKLYHRFADNYLQEPHFLAQIITFNIYAVKAEYSHWDSSKWIVSHKWTQKWVKTIWQFPSWIKSMLIDRVDGGAWWM